MKRLTRILAVVMVLSAVLLASAEAGVFTFSLPEAKKYAQKSDIDSIFAKRDIDNLTEANEDAIEDADEINVMAGTAETQLKSKVTKYIEPLRTAMNLEIALREEAQRLRQREYDVANAYWQVDLTELAIEKAESDLKIADNQYRAAKIKLEKGSISGAMLSSEKYNYEAKRLNLIESNHNRQKALFDLNEILEEPLTTVIKTNDTVKLEVSTDWQFNIEKTYAKALVADENIFRLEREVEFAKMKLQYAGEEFRTHKDEYLDVLEEKEKAEHNLKEAKNNLYISITAAGNNILNSIENYELLKLKLEIDQQNVKATEIKYNEGLISKNDYLRSRLGALNSEYTLNSTIVALNYNYHSFNSKYTFISK